MSTLVASVKELEEGGRWWRAYTHAELYPAEILIHTHKSDISISKSGVFNIDKSLERLQFDIHHFTDQDGWNREVSPWLPPQVI